MSYVTEMLDIKFPNLISLYKKEILGYGMHIVAFKYSEDKVFLISLEDQKTEFLEKMGFSIKENFYPEYFSEEFIEGLKDSEFTCFITDKVIPLDLYSEELSYVDDSYYDPVISMALRELSMYKSESCLIPREFSSTEEFQREIPEMINFLEDSFLTLLEDFNEDFLLRSKNSYIDYACKIFDSVKKSLYIIPSLEINKNFILDLHSEQFAIKNGELVCIDPIMIDFEPVFM